MSTCRFTTPCTSEATTIVNTVPYCSQHATEMQRLYPDYAVTPMETDMSARIIWKDLTVSSAEREALHAEVKRDLGKARLDMAYYQEQIRLTPWYRNEARLELQRKYFHCAQEASRLSLREQELAPREMRAFPR